MLTRRQTRLLLAPLLLLITLFLIVPMAYGLVVSLTDYRLMRPDFDFVGLENYARLLSSDIFLGSLIHVIVFTLLSVPLALTAGLAVAWALRRPFRLRGWVRAALLVPWLISPVAHGVLWHQMVNQQYGLAGYVPAALGWPPAPHILGNELAFAAVVITDVLRKAPLVAFLVLPGLLAISPSQWDNARLDGLSTLGQVRHIGLPHLRTLLATIALLLTGDALGTSESLLYLTGGGPGTRTQMPGLLAYNAAITTGDWVDGAASSWIILGITLIIGLVYVRLTTRQAGP